MATSTITLTPETHLQSDTKLDCSTPNFPPSSDMKSIVLSSVQPVEAETCKAKKLVDLPLQKPWDTANSIIKFKSEDTQFWWDRTGRLFAELIQAAGYSAAEQYRELIFYALFVAPELGLAPDAEGNVRGWRSPGTPDSTPIDFSWEWGSGNNATVRYSFECIGPNAGTALDPLNSFATDAWIQRLQDQQMVPGLDLEWYRHFIKAVLPSQEMQRKLTADVFIEETTPKAGVVVALDIEKTGPVMKMYIYPGLKALELGITNLQLVQRSIRGLPKEQYESLNCEPLLEYLDQGTARWGFETGILSIDCLEPKKARVKVYIRAKYTSLEYMMDCLTLGGKLDMSGNEQALEDLKDFWQTFLAEAPDVLPDELVGRASPGFYYTIGAGKPISPKVYISPTSFCKNDTGFLAKLRSYFSTRRSDQQMDNYEAALLDIFGKKTLDDRCGTHYYIGCALAKNQLRVVTYLSPQSFDCERDLINARKLECL